MASFFKASCMFYWVIWFFCLAYTLGVWLCRKQYPVDHELPSFQTSFQLMVILAWFNCSMCLIGCIWLKCDVTHIACAACFIIPVLTVNLSLSIYGLLELRKHSNFTGQEVFEVTSNELLEHHHHTAPIWLERAQKAGACCGVYSFLDYPMSFTKMKDSLAKIRVPCCKNHTESCYLELNITAAQPAQSIFESTCKLEPYTQISHYQKQFYMPSNLQDINPCGCHAYLTAHVNSISSAKFVFFLIAMFSSVIMVLIYVKNWCRDRQGVNAGSSHSLDIDELLIPDSHRTDEHSVERGSLLSTQGIVHPPVKSNFGIKPSLMSTHSALGGPRL